MTSEICARCQQWTDKPTVVGMEHGASVGGRTLHACPECAPSFPKQLDAVATAAAVRRALQPGRKRQTGWA